MLMTIRFIYLNHHEFGVTESLNTYNVHLSLVLYRRKRWQKMERTLSPTSILPLLLRLLQKELSQHTDPNPGTHTYAITTTNSQHRHTIFSQVWRTETQVML